MKTTISHNGQYADFDGAQMHPAMPPYKEVLTLDEAAFYLGYKKSYLYCLTSGRKIPFYKPGSKVFFKRSELDAWVFKNREKPDYEIQQDALNLTLRDK